MLPTCQLLRELFRPIPHYCRHACPASEHTHLSYLQLCKRPPSPTGRATAISGAVARLAHKFLAAFFAWVGCDLSCRRYYNPPNLAKRFASKHSKKQIKKLAHNQTNP